jgi:hypothetical protein
MSEADLDTLLSPPTSITWYYNYQATPSSYLSQKYPSIEFVPMLWGAPSNADDDTFTTQISKLKNMKYIMGFNEPDGESSTGGSSVTPANAAKEWIRTLEPLAKSNQNIKVLAPAVTGSPRGIQWLKDFFTECEKLGGCTTDIVPVHWYGDFQGLASHMGSTLEAVPNAMLWVTEYAMSKANLADSQGFAKTAAQYFDRLEEVHRYSYFGGFRSSKSNVGPNAAMLTQDGDLTDLGAAYLGKPATGKVPDGKVDNGVDGGVYPGLGGNSDAAGLLRGKQAVLAVGVAVMVGLLI